MGWCKHGAVVLALAAAVLVVGCGAGAPRRRAPSVATRTCSAVGYGGLRVGWRRRALILGPLALADLRAYTARPPLPPALGDRRGGYEVIAVVTHGTRPVLSLPRADWSTVGLLYDPNKFRIDGAYRLSDMDQVVRFRACENPASTTASASSTAAS
ncbi:MAG: hypothetical protein ACRDMX_15665 [Solirubrobacteraceae bacterium]